MNKIIFPLLILFLSGMASACLGDLECGSTGFIGKEFCLNNSVYKNFETNSCINPGLNNSECKMGVIPALVQDCNDNNELTLDVCVDNVTVAYCFHSFINPEIKCTRDSDCGTNGWVGDNFCISNDVTRNFVTYSCNNAGTASSSCSNLTETRVNQTCSDSCSGGSCTQISQINCTRDSECGINIIGNNVCSGLDIVRSFVNYSCENPGTARSRCVNISGNYLVNSCPESSYSDNYCSGDDVFRDFTSYSCENASCVTDLTKEIVKKCDRCSSGKCKTENGNNNVVLGDLNLDLGSGANETARTTKITESTIPVSMAAKSGISNIQILFWIFVAFLLALILILLVLLLIKK